MTEYALPFRLKADLVDLEGIFIFPQQSGEVFNPQSLGEGELLGTGVLASAFGPSALGWGEVSLSAFAAGLLLADVILTSPQTVSTNEGSTSPSFVAVENSEIEVSSAVLPEPASISEPFETTVSFNPVVGR